ncbi:hypothetical protein [Mucilaginibacter kameinonensis]|uniref:hypothetical protein n=1 Tax=Mucilaginibacter kameinonensis TaxID=452286 RepID=UPI0013CF1FC4|nr:hypothetical protein [Mucilaginibacter kameinonensis]
MAIQSRAAASRAARASALSQISQLGTARSEFTTADMFSTAENDVASFIERVKERIQSADMVVTGEIENIKMETSESGIKILAPAYLLFQDKGVRGAESSELAPDSPFAYKEKMPPYSAFINYINTKNIQLRNEEFLHGKPSPHEDLEGDEKAIKTAAFLMARKVYKKGFKPRNIFTPEIPQLVEDLQKTIKGFSADWIKSGIKGGASGDVFKRATTD